MKQQQCKENVERVLRNFSTMALYHTTLTSNEVDYLFDKFDNTIFCRGELRTIIAQPLTANIFKVFTQPF